MTIIIVIQIFFNKNDYLSSRLLYQTDIMFIIHDALCKTTQPLRGISPESI